MLLRQRVALGAITVVLITLVAFAKSAGGDDQIQYVSVAQLIASPDKFDGKLISVIGFLRLDNEASLLYSHADDYENVILSNALWLDATSMMHRESEKTALKYVKIVGVFKAGSQGKSRFSVGGITNIQSCELWSDPADPLARQIRRMHGHQ